MKIARACVKAFEEDPGEATIYIVDPDKVGDVEVERTFRPTFYVDDMEILGNGWLKYTIEENEGAFSGLVSPSMVEWADTING